MDSSGGRSGDGSFSSAVRTAAFSHGRTARLKCRLFSRFFRSRAAWLLPRLEFQPLIEAAAARAARQHGVGLVFEFEGADAAAQAVAQSEFFAPGTPPDIPEPEAEDRVQINEQVNENQVLEFDVNHGFAVPV